MSDLYLSAKFSDYLREIGMLEALINALKIYREKENYPFELKDKRIMKMAIFKGLCDYFSGNPKKPTVEKILERTEQIAERLYGKERPKTVGEEIIKGFKKYGYKR